MYSSKRYLGSNQLLTSVSNKEIIPDAPSNWTMGYELSNFSIMNYDDCTLVINDIELFLKSNQGFSTDIGTTVSVKIKEDGIQYNWIGVY